MKKTSNISLMLLIFAAFSSISVSAAKLSHDIHTIDKQLRSVQNKFDIPYVGEKFLGHLWSYLKTLAGQEVKPVTIAYQFQKALHDYNKEYGNFGNVYIKDALSHIFQAILPNEPDDVESLVQIVTPLL